MQAPERLFPRGKSTMVDVLQWRAAHQPERVGHSFLIDGEKKREDLSYKDLAKDAKRIAAVLQSKGQNGDRVMLLFPPGLDFVRSFMGTLYAGMTAIPLYPHFRPKKDQMLDKIVGVAKDAKPLAILANSAVKAGLTALFELAPILAEQEWIFVEDIPANADENWKDPQIDPDSIAFLQYTSGSTGDPKGVMVSHNNMISNLEDITYAYQSDPEDVGIIWLPPYHDMGLIGGILTPLYVGFKVILMPPVYFLQRPYRWLKAISDHKATISGGPNFAFDYAVRKIKPEQLETLDLSNWKLAFNGAEPIHSETLLRFATTFASTGFDYEFFFPCFGLAEGTLFVAGAKRKEAPITISFDGQALEQNEAKPVAPDNEHVKIMVSSGYPAKEQIVKIVDPDTKEEVKHGRIGEVWVKGDNIAQGYWGKPELSEETFQAYTSDKNEGPFMRTGDLGFLYTEHLFITGRIKDLIIIDGSNHYPQDIEKTAENAHKGVAPNGVAAFSITRNNAEALVVVVELDRRAMRHMEGVTEADVKKSIRSGISKNHELKVFDIIFVPKRIPKTTSGKVQRRLCRKLYLSGEWAPKELS